MKLEEWERDVRNRQRNIVFPDTNLNAGRYYRNIVSGKAVYTLGHRISLSIIVAIHIAFMSVILVDMIGELLVRKVPPGALMFLPCVYPLAVLLFWVFLAVKGLSPASASVRKRRRRYRQSHRA